MKIVVVTVTFNSSNFLERCVDALNAQTVSVDNIIVIDNNSNNQHKNEVKRIVKKYDNIDLYELEENTGGAGGFEYGMKKASELKPDWVWIMDDDAFPTSNCLEQLLEQKNYDHVGAICPAIYGVDLNKYQVYHHKKISKVLMKDIPMFSDFQNFPDVFEIDSNAFVGPLIKGHILQECGVAEGGLFIYGDDTEYTFRIKQKYRIIVVKKAVINHRDVEAPKNSINPKAWWKDYYMYRNRFFFIKKYSNNFLQKFIAYNYQKFIIYLRCISTLIKPKFKGYRKIKIKLYKKAIKDAKRNLLGKIIDPQKYIKYINDFQKEV